MNCVMIFHSYSNIFKCGCLFKLAFIYLSVDNFPTEISQSYLDLVFSACVRLSLRQYQALILIRIVFFCMIGLLQKLIPSPSVLYPCATGGKKTPSCVYTLQVFGDFLYWYCFC